MPSAFQDFTLEDIAWERLTRDQLVDIRDNDERTTAQQKAAERVAELDIPPRLDPEEYNPRTDKGPERYEDRLAAPAETPVDDYPEVSDDEVRRDETTLLASDDVRTNDDNEIEIVPRQ